MDRAVPPPPPPHPHPRLYPTRQPDQIRTLFVVVTLCGKGSLLDTMAGPPGFFRDTHIDNVLGVFQAIVSAPAPPSYQLRSPHTPTTPPQSLPPTPLSITTRTVVIMIKLESTPLHGCMRLRVLGSASNSIWILSKEKASQGHEPFSWRSHT